MLHHFIGGLTPQWALTVDTSAGGAFVSKTPKEGKEIIERIVQNLEDRPLNEVKAAQSLDQPLFIEPPPEPKPPEPREIKGKESESFYYCPTEPDIFEEDLVPPPPLSFEEKKVCPDFGNLTALPTEQITRKG